MNIRRVAAGVVAATLLGAAGCHERRPGRSPAEPATAIGTYRGVASSESGKPQRFRVLLWAALPDRIHAELLGPIGGPDVIVDGGGGRLAVTLVRERTAYVGDATRAAIEAVTGIAVRLDDLVRWIVSGADEVAAGIEVERTADGTPGLPLTLEIRDGAHRIRIERRHVEGVEALPSGTGTGAPPPGFEEKPIAELPPAVWPGSDAERGGAP